MRDCGYKTNEVLRVYAQVDGNTIKKQQISLKTVISVSKKVSID